MPERPTADILSASHLVTRYRWAPPRHDPATEPTYAELTGWMREANFALERLTHACLIQGFEGGWCCACCDAVARTRAMLAHEPGCLVRTATELRRRYEELVL